MATFGVEGISDFDNARKTGQKGLKELEDVFFLLTICEELVKGLKKYKHAGFYLSDTQCKEKHLRDKTFQGGEDHNFADDVNLFFIATHGNSDKGIISLAYDTKENEWSADSRGWKLGDKNCKWLLMWACSTLDLKEIKPLLHIFQNLHEICGAYGPMNLFFSTNEAGEDVADNLTKYNKPVADAWIDGMKDWLTNNHPMVVAAENSDSINVMGRSDWPLTTMACDHLTGHGTTVPDIPNSDIYWLSVKWREVQGLWYDVKRRRTQIK